MNNRLKVSFAGIELENPLIAASAGTTKDAEHAFRSQEAGFAAVILKSIQEEEVNRYNPFPRFAVLRNGIPGYNSVSFMSYEQAYEGDIDDYCEEIRKTKERVEIPVIASLNCANPETWSEYAVVCDQAGADAIEIVPSCPVGIFVRDAAEFYPVASYALKTVREKVKSHVGVKMTQQMSNPIICAKQLDEEGSDWITMFNRSSGLQIDLDTMSPIMHKGACGHGGPWVINSTLRWIAQSFPHIKAPISATGGVTNWEDVARYMLAGAVNVQIASLVYLKGYGVVKDINMKLLEYLDKQGIENITDIIGTASKQLKSLQDADRSGRYYASIDYAKCIKCKKCKDICIYDAISYTDSPAIDKDICDGCGLCEQVCNRAITMNKK